MWGGFDAYESMVAQRVRVVAAFARRPKVLHSGEPILAVKINSQLLDAAHAGSSCGIPVLAGVPLVNSLLAFSMKVRCGWYRLTLEHASGEDLNFAISVPDLLPVAPECPGIVGPLARQQLVDVVRTASSALEWSDAVHGLRAIVSCSHSGRARWPAPQYRPFCVVIPQER